ncbi:hypothetical protein TSAR_005900 [Trichomalopsis sarcophagae]|uniref:THAP-type domain-containing protein n=1 Tax=Trichomalopsis sarcophagae TaxID=543379 RepID=A0A232FKV6_9HYME|nr:hypothetical protein TSAR_005900 [Trichomalopsis sarcophagae]
MPSCSVKFCRNWNGNATSRSIKFFKYPVDARIADIWIKACENENLILKNARICSIHFTEDCFERKPEHLIVPGDTNIIRLSKTAIPTLNLHIKIIYLILIFSYYNILKSEYLEQLVFVPYTSLKIVLSESQSI